MTGIFQILLAGQGAPTILADYLVVAGGAGGGIHLLAVVVAVD